MKALVFLTAILVAASAYAQPWEPFVLWDRSGAGDSSRYGVAYALGDQNEDGYADFAVWALGWGGPGQVNEAVVEFFHGGNSPTQVPYMTYRAHAGIDHQFYRFQTVGDLNGDGFIDWQIWRVPSSDPLQIAFETYWGGSDTDTLPDLIFHAPWISDIWLFPAGDMNGDHYDDLYLWRSGSPDYGQLFNGGAQMDTLPDWTLRSRAGHRYEALPDAFGDLNSDGRSDFVSGTPPPEQMIYIFVGGTPPDTMPRYSWSNFYHTDKIILRSLNSDGYSDIAFSGYPQWTVHLGGDSISPDPAFLMNFFGNCSWNFAAGLGDINGDGYNDMCAIDPGCNNLWGTLCIYLGHPWLNADPAVIIQGRSQPLNLVGINGAVGVGDVNGDSLDDFAIWGFNNNFDGFRGRSIILSGDTGLTVSVDVPPPIANAFSVSVYPNPFNSQATVDLFLPTYIRNVELQVYNVLGQRVEGIVLPVSGARIVYSLNASAWPSGLYFLIAQTVQSRQTTKLIVLK